MGEQTAGQDSQRPRQDAGPPAPDAENPVNNSGSGGPPPPAVVRMGWSWGAFLAGWVWAARHRTWIGLLDLPFTLYPPVWLGFRILLGVKGNTWAWQHRRFRDVGAFVRSQRAWARWGIAVAFGQAILALALFGLLSAAGIGTFLDQCGTAGGG